MTGRLTRRRSRTRGVALAFAAVWGVSAGGAVQPEGGDAAADRDEARAEDRPLDDEITPELDDAVARGLEWLALQQQDDGSFAAGRFGQSVAITSLACLAFMADGQLPGRGGYGDVVERGLEHVLTQATESGLVAGPNASGPMYGHGFATLFLGEIYGATAGGPDTALAARLHEALLKAVRLIERTQNPEGGWRYNPAPNDADVSVTICQVMALRSARNAGIEVDKQVIDNAVAYIRRCQNADGGFRYQSRPGPSAWPRSAAGVATLFYAGEYDDRAIDLGVTYLRRVAIPGRNTQPGFHYWYGQYYAVQATYLAGGDAWADWWPALRAELLGEQEADGRWNGRSVGDEYATSMALIILQIPKRYLPIFQR